MSANLQDPEKKQVDQLIKLYNDGQIKKLINQTESLIKIYPNSFILWNILGVSLHSKKDSLNKAIEAYRKCVTLKPDYADAYNNLGVALQNQNSQDEALQVYKKAILLKPDYDEAYNNMGGVLKKQGKLDESTEAYQKCISINPNNSQAYYNLGNVLKEQDKTDKAIEFYKKSISINPKFAEAYNNMGNVYKEQGKLKESIDCFNKSISFKPDYAEAHHNLSISLLNDGKIIEGLEKYEWRFKTINSSSSRRHFSKPEWDGKEKLNNKRILVWSEQGIGDTLNWCSRLNLLESTTQHCILECQKKLVPLLKRSFPSIDIRPEDRHQDLKRNDFDFHIPLGSLYKHYIKDILKSPKINPYLIPDQNKVNFWKGKLNSLGKGPYIGICWKSSVKSNFRRLHYPLIHEWAPILNIPKLTFINLQYIDFEKDLNEIQNKFGVKVHNFENLDQYNDIDDLAALSAALDFVVSTKITPPIITSGVGTPTIIANWKQSIFNNILTNPVSSSLKMIEKNTFETWDNVFSSIAKEIIKFKDKNFFTD